MKRPDLLACLALASLIAIPSCKSTGEPEIDPVTGLPVETVDPGEDGEPKKRGWGWFGRGNDADEEETTDIGEVPDGLAESATDAPAPPQEVDEDAPIEEQFRQAAGIAASTASGGTATGRDDWMFSATELLRLSRGSAASNPGATDAIADYARSLKRNGVQLIVVPVPPKSLIYADYLSDDWKPGSRAAADLGSDIKAAIANLRARGVTVIDSFEMVRDDRRSRKGRSYPKTGAQISPRAAEKIAATVAEVARTGGWLNDNIKVSGISGTETTVGLDGSLGGSAETVPARAVRQDEGLVPSSPNAPLLILGDATATAGRSTGTSFADQLAHDLRVPIDIQASDGDGRNVPRTRVLRKSVVDPGYASRKKCVVWIFNASELALRDWRKVPLALEMQESEETLRDADEA